MTFVKRAGAVVGATALSLATLTAISIPAHAATTYVVDEDGAGTAADCDAATPASTTIQAAVDLTIAGDTVVVCPGVFVGAVVSTDITILCAQDGVDARTRNAPLAAESVIDSDGFTGLQLQANGITVDGCYFTDNAVGLNMIDGFSGYNIRNNIFFANTIGLGLATINDDTGNPSLIEFNDFDANNGAASDAILSGAGTGIYGDIGDQYVTIQRNLFQNHINSGILLAHVVPTDYLHLDLHILRNIFNNNATAVALWSGQRVEINRNQTNDTIPADDGVQGSAIFVGAANDDIEVAINVIRNSPFNGIALRDQDGFGAPQPGGLTDTVVRSNTIINSDNNGIDATAAGNGTIELSRNRVTRSVVDGLHLGPDTVDYDVIVNRANADGGLDCHDESTAGGGTAGTANRWLGNRGRTQSPAGICR